MSIEREIDPSLYQIYKIVSASNMDNNFCDPSLEDNLVTFEQNDISVDIESPVNLEGDIK
jgi:hypothetical protein